MYAKTEMAQNDTDLLCIKLDINVSKCFTKAQHFAAFKFLCNSKKHFDIVFMFMASPTILWIRSVSPTWVNMIMRRSEQLRLLRLLIIDNFMQELI